VTRRGWVWIFALWLFLACQSVYMLDQVVRALLNAY
jgi:hypothetical protein